MRCNKVFVNNNKLERFDFDIKKTLKAYRKVEDTELGILLINHNSNNNLDFDFHFVFLPEGIE